MSAHTPMIETPPASLPRALRRAALGMALATAAIAPAAWAQGAAESQFDIPAGSVNSALAQFAATAGVNISFEPGAAQGQQSAGLHGRYTVDSGLRQLLAGSQLQAVLLSNGSYSLIPRVDGTVQLDPTSISGKATEPASGPMEGYVATRSSSGSKTDTPIIEIPQSVSVITRQQMQAQGAQTVTDALRYVPGVKVEAYGLDPKGFDWLYIRGFNGQASSDYLNGLRQQNNSYAFFRSEPYAFDRIDVVRGPASSLFGQGDAGGIINRVSKKPEANHVNEVQLTGGNHDRMQGQFDIGGALDDDQHLLYRVVGLARDADTQVEYADGHELKDDRLYIAPSFTWTPDEDTSLTVLTDFLRDHNGGSLFAYSTPNGHTTNILMGDHSFNHLDQEQYSLGYEFRHRLNDTWEFRQNARYGQVDVIFQNLLPAAVNTSTGNVTRIADRFDQHMDTFNLDNQLQADFTTGPLTHKLLMGLDYTWQDADITRWRTLAPNLNLYDPQYGKDITRPTSANSLSSIDYDQTIEQVGGYLQDQIKFDDHWILTAGGRYDYVRNALDNHVGASTNQKDNAFTGRVGLTYLTEFGLAPYVSYAESFTPNTGTDRNGSAFDPSMAHQWEMGVKYQPTDAILMTLAAYDLTKTNVLTNEIVGGVNTGFTVASGEQQSKGIEAEIKARLDQNWDLIASYTYTHAEITKSNRGDEGNRPANVPKHMASTWLNYTFHDTALNGLSLGGGARYTGALYGDNGNTYHIDNYTLFDAGVSYPINKNVTVSVNAQNLLDTEYVATCDDTYECYPGLRRTLLTSVKYTW
ncbi:MULTISPECIES: TonB-dependent siderophore receptor [unclassified Pseudomonas]|uniref:TonB-dependent siderophore receptor n=1 Tax=unclassified Pseudomonas TaxID=196821 RepID=UPI0015A013CF|nr:MULTISPECIES: TonB-dependent siderophore receptor [unclassified Pseudomonas]NWC93797.1 TonB-dependent siderophore receptor [Pseudomonas sp. IPO3779]NWD16229.1 TonB-dependent siderophore receptor [Pseudomonas sp. IPO3778]